MDTIASARKATPVYSGFLKFFPLAVAEVARASVVGANQHNPGAPIAWDRSKSGDEADALSRHLLDAGTLDTDGIRHSAKVAWRAMALLQKELEAVAAEEAELLAEAEGEADVASDEDSTMYVSEALGQRVKVTLHADAPAPREMSMQEMLAARRRQGVRS